jgi:hypothetical protein
VNLTSKVIEFKDLGVVCLFRSTKAKKLSISVRPFEGIRVTVPVFINFSRAEKFIEEKESWLRRNMAKIAFAEKSLTVFDYDTAFHTVDHFLKIVRVKGEKPLIKLNGGVILAFCPEGRDIKENEIQQMIRRGIETAWRKEAKKYLPVRLGELARSNGLVFRKISIKNNRSRWGSCSVTNNINLSLHLMRLPENLSDYVMLHELVHTIHKNHSKRFWDHLNGITGNAKVLDKELKKYRIEIY